MKITEMKTQQEEYIKYLQLKDKSSQTIKNYNYTITEFIKYIETTNTEEITNTNINNLVEGYQAHLKAEGNRSSETINQYCLRLRGYIKKLGFNYNVEKIKEEKNKPVKFLTLEEIQEVINTLKETKKNPETIHKLEALICLMFNCGLRLDETLKLKIKHIQYTGDGYKLIIYKGKGNKNATLGLSNQTYKKIVTMLQDRENTGPEEPLFANYKGKPMSQQAVRKHFQILATATDKSLKKKQGHEPEPPLKVRFTPHSLRHSLAVYLLNVKKEPVNVVKQTLRHASIQTTQHYLNLNDVEIINLMNELTFENKI